MLPVDIMRVAASASVRALAKAIDDGAAPDQMTALLAVVLEDVEMLSTMRIELSGNAPIDPCPMNVVSIADHRRRQRLF